MDPNQIMLGKYSMPFLLSMILGLIFKKTSIADDWKPFIAAGTGIAVGVAAMFYQEIYTAINFQMIADYSLAGLMAGFSAVGIYEATKESGVGRTYVALDANNKRIPGAKVAKVNKLKIMDPGPLK